MIYRGGIEQTGLKTPKNETLKRGLTVQAIYHKGIILYQAIRSCFGSGIWVNAKPWLNGEAYKN